MAYSEGMPKFIDLAGRRFGRWTVLKRVADYAPPSKPSGGIPQWLCFCDCGNRGVVTGGALTSGKSSSCGCYNLEVRSRICVERNTKHGLAKTPTHVTWMLMRQRCLNPNATAFKNYGAKGITVSDRWERFENFLADMGERPTLAHTLDRIDNSKGYEPGNCRWATMRDQQNNRTNNRRLTWRGETKTLLEWSRLTGIPHRTIGQRLDRLGWSVDEALSRAPSPLPRPAS